MSRSIGTQQWSQAVRLIQSSDRAFVGTHVRPDGDALGSLLGLALVLEERGLQVARLCADPAPLTYAFLPGAELITAQLPDWSPQLGMVVDCDGISRLGPLEPSFAALPHLIDIDHHATNRAFGELRLIDSKAAAAAEIVFALVRELDTGLDPDIATCLYTGIITDTGRFCYGNTTAATFRIAGELVRAGAEPDSIARRVYAERSIAATHLLGAALSHLAAELNGEVVSSALTLADFAATGAAPADTEGIIDHLRAIAGPRVALLLVELEDHQVRVSFRSDGTVDVSAVALEFGGGGHAMASGCTCPGSLQEVRREVLAAVARALSESGCRDAR